MQPLNRHNGAQFLDPRILKASALGPRDSIWRVIPTAIRAFTAEYFDVVLNIGADRRKVCKIQFRAQQNGLAVYAHMSSFGYSHGRLRRVTFSGPPAGPDTVDFLDGGTTTTQMVKYHHPADGRAHFSQDGKEVSYFAESKPLRKVAGHLFTMHFWGADGFALAGSKEDRTPTAKRATVNLYADPKLRPGQVSGRIVCWCYPRHDIPLIGPIVPGASLSEPGTWILESGERRQTIIFAPPSPAPRDDLIFLLTFHPMERDTGPDYPVMVFMGGFDGTRDQSRADSHSSCLVLKYSKKDEDFEEMVRLTGSIDYSG
jgi:hypothetical protein